MRDTRNDALRQAHETLAEEINRLSKEALREGMKSHTLPQGSKAEAGLDSKGAVYTAKFTYDGGTFTADANAELFDRSGNRVARLTGWGNTIGRGTFTASGTVTLNYQPHEIKDWQFTYILESNLGGVSIRWTGSLFERIGNGIFEKIEPQGISVGAGYVQVP